MAKRKRGHMPEWMLAALHQELNPSLDSTGEGAAKRYFVVAGERRWQLQKTDSKQQLIWRLSCMDLDAGRRCRRFCGHYKQCTADALRSKDTLLCTLCNSRGVLQQHGRGGMSEHTALPFVRLVGSQFPAAAWSAEVHVLAGWPGLADLYFRGSRLIVQIDGVHHFAWGMRGQDLGVQCRRDLACNLLAWHQGARMLRLHYLDLGSHGLQVIRHVLDTLCTYPGGPLLVLSRSFSAERSVGSRGLQSYADSICDIVAATGGTRSTHANLGYTMLTM